VPYFQFIRQNRRYLLFGFLLAFASSFGQTWFIGLFKERLLADHGLTHGSYGSWYALATLSSALCLSYLGRLVDRVDLRTFTVFVCAGLAAACSLMFLAQGLVLLVIALFGLRLFGQGLASHTSSTATARYFDAQRGKALSVVSMGHPSAEAVLPLSVVGLLALFGDWRQVWLVSALVVALVLTPTVLGLLRGHGERHERLIERIEREAAALAGARQWSAREVLRDWGFYLLLPAVLAPAFISTGLMFHQDVLRDSMGWSAELFASSFVVFSIVQVLTAPVAGVLVDRFTARRLLPTFLLPYCLALFAISLHRSDSMVLVLMIGMGLSAGISYSVVGGTWAERYGVRHLGAIRSLVTVVMVISTALAPPMLGLLIDGGVGMPSIAMGLGVYTLVASALVLGIGAGRYGGKPTSASPRRDR
jgi:MFS family permease